VAAHGAWSTCQHLLWTLVRVRIWGSVWQYLQSNRLSLLDSRGSRQQVYIPHSSTVWQQLLAAAHLE